jgi:hypothetical protein
VDSQSRLRNLEAAEQQLVKLLESATDLQYTLEIFRERPISAAKLRC